MFIAVIDDSSDLMFMCETKQELDAEIKEHYEYNLSEGDTMTVTYYEPVCKKTVSLEYVERIISEQKEPVKAGKTRLEV